MGGLWVLLFGDCCVVTCTSVAAGDENNCWATIWSVLGSPDCAGDSDTLHGRHQGAARQITRLHHIGLGNIIFSISDTLECCLHKSLWWPWPSLCQGHTAWAKTCVAQCATWTSTTLGREHSCSSTCVTVRRCGVKQQQTHPQRAPWKWRGTPTCASIYAPYRWAETPATVAIPACLGSRGRQ